LASLSCSLGGLVLGGSCKRRNLSEPNDPFVQNLKARQSLVVVTHSSLSCCDYPP